MNEILAKVIVTVVSTIAVGALALIFRSVRTAIFYKRVEYDLVCQRKPNQSPFRCSWDIHWEDYGLTFRAGDISNDNVKDVTFAKLGGRSEPIPALFPSESYKPLFGGEIQAKVNSIIRMSPESGEAVYTLRLVLRRRRSFL
jgi:hypothetical protein